MPIKYLFLSVLESAESYVVINVTKMGDEFRKKRGKVFNNSVNGNKMIINQNVIVFQLNVINYRLKTLLSCNIFLEYLLF